MTLSKRYRDSELQNQVCSMFINYLIITALCLAHTHALPACSETEVFYNSTSCSPHGGHYIITFPLDPTKCEVKSGPRYVEDCTETCPPGQALDANTSKCNDCPLGTAAPGDVFEVNNWPEMPDGFYSDILNNKDGASSCEEFGFKPQGTYIIGKANSMCASELTLENRNIKEGKIEFEYKFSDPLATAYFTVRNDRCVLENGQSHILPPSSKNTWSTFSTDVPSGYSTIQWYLFPENYFDSADASSEIKIRSVRVTGRPATINCPECQPGYYADKVGSHSCSKCPWNTYSDRRAGECEPCPEGQYSLPGSGSCAEKIPCQPSEYVTVYSTCTTDTNKQHLITKPIEPVICEDKTQNTQQGPDETCKPCPLGSKRLNQTHCDVCPIGFLSSSDGLSCKMCPPGEVPVFGYQFNTWSRMPPKMNTYCLEHDGESGCQTWQLNGSSIFAGPGLGQGVHSVLELDLSEGFLGSKPDEPYFLYRFASPLPGTEIVVDFELDCRGKCSLSLFADFPLITIRVNKWNGPLPRTNFTFTPFECEGGVFAFEFTKWSSETGELSPETRNDRVIIHSITVTNARGAGALSCKKCPMGVDGQFCKPCADGLFYTMVTNVTTGESHAECVPCPNGTTVIGDASALMTVEQACKACPPGTIPGRDEECLLDLKPTTADNRSYDFTDLLSSELAAVGTKLFTSQGNEFQQHFKFFLNTQEPKSKVKCVNHNKYDANVTAWICRETWSPNKDSSGAASHYRYKALSLGDKLEKGVPTNYSREFRTEVTQMLGNAGWKPDESGTDYHLIFKTKSSTSVCKDGINTVVTLRCGSIYDDFVDEIAELALVQLPPKCAVGTCDGCRYHFMIVSQLACPICRTEDYTRIEGGCHSGTMQVTLLPPENCRPAPGFVTVFLESCPRLSTQGKIGVGLTLALVLLLLLTILYCYQRNKKLEYKYMKLVEGAEARARSSLGSGSPNSNQQSTECGIPDDDRETDLYPPSQGVSAITGGNGSNKWNQLSSRSFGDSGASAGFGPVIFRKRTADDSHILTLEDGNQPI